MGPVSFRPLGRSMRRCGGIALALFAISLLAEVAMACTACIGAPAKWHFKRSAALFVGEVLNIEPNGETRLSVVEAWKGSFDGEAVVFDLRTSCGFGQFKVGSRYLVDARPGPQGQLIVDMCGLTRLESSNDPTIDRIRRRYKWWRCPLSSFTPRLLRYRGDKWRHPVG